MTNAQCPKNDQIPNPNWSLGIPWAFGHGNSLVIGHWTLVIFPILPKPMKRLLPIALFLAGCQQAMQVSEPTLQRPEISQASIIQPTNPTPQPRPSAPQSQSYP